MNRTQIFEKFKSLIPYFLLAVAIIVAYRVSGSLGVFGSAVAWVWAVVSPFFWGFILAYIINIPCGSVQRMLARSGNGFVQRKQRMLSVIIVFIIILGLITLALSFIIPAVVNSIALFIYNFDDYWAGVVALIDNINDLGLFPEINDETISAFLGNIFADFSIENLAQPLNAIMGLGNAIFGWFIAIIASIYILIEKNRIKELARRLFRVFSSKGVSREVSTTSARLNRYFRQYIRVQTIDGMILGTMATVALWIIGSPFAGDKTLFDASINVLASA